jgi:hypothetical protein
MAALKLGVESPSGKEFEVLWDPQSKDLYVDGTLIGKAEGPIEAMLLAAEEVRDK